MILLNNHTDPFLAVLLGEVQFSAEETATARTESHNRELRVAARNAELRAAAPRECPKCSGRGTLQEFAHVDAGECYKCKGTGSLDRFGRPAGANKVLF